MAKSEILIPNSEQADHLIQLGAAVTAATRMDQAYTLKSDQYRKILKGYALGAFRELRSEGLGIAASAVIFHSKNAIT